MELTIGEEIICSKYMNVNGECHCGECPLNLTSEYGVPACYATIDGRGLPIKRYNDIPENVIKGIKEIAKYCGISVHQMSYNRDELKIPYYMHKKKMYAVKEELDEWRKEQEPCMKTRL